MADTPPAYPGNPSNMSGRAVSQAWRQARSAGKAALPPATERVRTGGRTAAVPAAVAVADSPPAPANTALSDLALREDTAGARTAAELAAQGAVSACSDDSCRAQARARRAAQSLRGRGEAPAAAPSRGPRLGRLDYAPKFVASTTHAQATVTGIRIGQGSGVTGLESGATVPVSGTQYIGSETATPVRAAGSKVGFVRTPGGIVVSGTLLRSQVAVTGDEAGAGSSITGEADQRLEDDLTPRVDLGGFAAAQFQRQVDPHGHSVFGTNLGRNAAVIGSRLRPRGAAPIESTQSGLAITGAAIGRSLRVTGDEPGACHHITGDQYLTPAQRQAECGGAGGGTALSVAGAAARPDPVTGAKVMAARTWGGRSVTGVRLEHEPRVSGAAAGTCAALTGSAYQGPDSVQGWCDEPAVTAAEARALRRPAMLGVTGDLPGHEERVTGTARGARRAISGTPYYRDEPAPAAVSDPVVRVERAFSVHSAQRSAQLRSQHAKADSSAVRDRITGSFAFGAHKVTGNHEFHFTPRYAAHDQTAPAHTRVSGEGRTSGRAISGGAWTEGTVVTGTENATAAGRNPSLRAGQPQSFAGARQFKTLAQPPEERRQLVTGMVGWSGRTAANVTLSGGAQA